MIQIVRARQKGDDAQGDRGTTLVELLVAMGIFVILLVVFMQATAMMAKSTVRSESVSDTASQLRTVFQRLDKEVRYASDINSPGTVNGAIYLEYWVPESAANGESMCVQWRYVIATSELQRRTWAQGNAASVSGWSTMVTRLRNDLGSPAQAPFVVQRAGATAGKVYTRQKLDVFLDAGIGNKTTDSGSQLNVSFVAQNSSTASVTNNGTQKVCLVGGVQRP